MKQSDRHGFEDDIRRRWNSSSDDYVTLTDLQRILRRNSVVARLRRRAFMLFLVSCTGPALIFMLTRIQPVSLVLVILYSAFMLGSAAAQLYWWYRLGQIYQYMTIPVIEAQRKMEEIDSLRRNIKIFSIMIGFPIIFLLFYEVAVMGHEGELTGAVIGGVIGIVIGLCLERLNRRQVKALKNSFYFEDDVNATDRRDK